MNNASLKQLALENGFSRAYVFFPERAERPEINRMNERVSDDARDIFEETKRVIVLLYPYKAFEADGDRPLISAYYVASNSAYHAAKRIETAIREEGYQAFSNAHIAIKPFLLRMGVGKTGRNSLVSVDGLGTRFHVQIILTDMPIETDPLKKPGVVSDLCKNCSLCVKACPTGAILKDGRIDIDRCLRARDDGDIVPEEIRALYENRILGCDVCQNVCPRNRGQELTGINAEIQSLTSLEALLDGKVKDLSEYIGGNYARKERIRLKAALVCANLKRYDLIPRIREMAQNGTDKEKIHARWALDRLLESMEQE